MIVLDSILEWTLFFTLLLLIAGMAASAIRLIIGPTIWDQLLMINIISTKVVMFVVIYAILTDSILVLDIAIAYSIAGFLTITLLAKFVMTGGREK